MSRVTAGLVLALSLAPGLPGQAETPAQPERTFALRDVARAETRTTMVAAAHPAAVAAGRDILAAGGSAADAAIAVQLVLNVVEPQSSGLGGGTFLLYWDASDAELTSLDGRETAPALAAPDLWLQPDGKPRPFAEAVPGGRSVGVPGTLATLAELHARHGRLPWADLFAPAIALAENGFPVSPRLSASIAEAAGRGLGLFPATRAAFLQADGTAPPPGTVMHNRELARTLRLLAAQGAAPFYEGVLAGDLVATVRRAEVNPGLMTRADLEAYAVIDRPPVCVPYRVWVICGMGPPSSGGLTVGQIMGMLGAFDLAALGDGAAAWHLVLEATRLAFADRALYMADADFVAVPGTLTDPAYLASRAALIDPARAMATAAPGTPPWPRPEPRAPALQAEAPGTTHFVVADARGDLISVTSSIETGFGSRLMSGGFLLNNELTDFEFVPERDGAPVANRAEGGKRPRSSMAPTIVFRDGVPVLLLGSPGGARIIPYVVGTLVRILDFGMDPAAALGAGHVVTLGRGVELEEGTAALALEAELVALGHAVKAANLNSGLHVIRVAPGLLTGAADPRREGDVAGD